MRPVELSPGAVRDLVRLEAFLLMKSERAALAAAAAITAAVTSLAEFSDRGHPSKVAGRRELIVRYGRDGYVIRYRVTPERVLVARIFHGRERR